MRIVKERTRLIITEYTNRELRDLEDLVASLDNVFMYRDPDDQFVAMPTGMVDTLKKQFKCQITDHSSEYWDYAKTDPVEHNAQPRNQLQIDFINFVLECAKKKEKLAGILSPGTGKAQPLSTKIPTPTEKGWTYMGDLKPGDWVYDYNGDAVQIWKTFPQGIRKVFRVDFEDGRYSYCDIEHLWSVSIDKRSTKYKDLHTFTLGSLIHIMKSHDVYVPAFTDLTMTEKESLKIVDVKYDRDEESQCIMLLDAYHMYVTEDYVLTHNTFMACYSAIKLQLRTLIIVPTSSIKVQWRDTLINMFQVPPEKVLMVSRPKDFINIKADFVIVSQASLMILNKTYDLNKIMKSNKFGIKVIDEVQMWFQNIINVDANSNIANNWYLTGTFGRSGTRENEIYQEMFGDLKIFREKEKKPTIFNRKPGNIYGMKPHVYCKMIWTNSGLTKRQIEQVTSSMRYSEREGKWIRYGVSIPAYTELVIPSDGSDTKFLKIIRNVVKEALSSVSYGRTLMLGTTVNSAEIVAAMMHDMYPDLKIGTISSRNSKDENRKVKEECDIVVSTIKSAGTGFDMKDLSRLITFTPWSSWILSDQIHGRLRRRPDGKPTYMWDITDNCIPQLRSWANNRADVYRRKSKEFKVVDM
jgi:superfamily II DNA or RNA helicase